MDNKQLIAETIVTPELYFLISKFLSAGPLQETAKVLVRELEEKKVLPKRTDFLGYEHDQNFAELERKYSHIGPKHLLEICCRIGPVLDKDLTPSVPGILSLLGSGRQSLLRTKDSIYRPRSILDYCTRIHGVSLPDSALTRPVHNLQRVLIGREYGGPVRRKLLMPTSFYSKTKLLRRTVGHLSSVYCVLFDRTGKYIITGADDLLIKIWSAMDGRLLATLRGASAEITDIAINLDNTMLAAGSVDRILRVWDMQTTSPIAVLSAHTGMITSVNFCPSPRTDLKYLVTTSTDGSVAFWQYTTPRGQKTTFAPKPTQYHEKLRPGQAQMMCTSFSPGGMFLAAVSADHHVRVYNMTEDGPKRILETEAYTDAVDSVQWAHRGLRFISGSKDGTAHIWSFESQQWKSVKLCMTERLPTCPEPEEGKKLKVTMVAWDCSDHYAITAANDYTIKIWHSKTAKLHCVLRGHKDELYVLESNPKDEHVLLSAGHDGQIFIWDIEKGVSVAHFINDIDGQGHGGVFDAKWSPDGSMIAATDSHGHILIFGLGIGAEKYKILPNELFFHTDYRPLLRDASHHVVDEQTQIMPHLMPPPFLVDADGNPHPAKYQRYVPGRESCSTDQLIPNITVNGDGVSIDDSFNHPQIAGGGVAAGAGGGLVGAGAGAGPVGNNYSHIDRMIAVLANRSSGSSNQLGGGASHSQLDRMIEALAHRQGQDQAPDSNNRRSDGNILGNGPSTSRGSGSESVAGRQFPDGGNTPRPGTSWGRPPAQQPVQQESPLQQPVNTPMAFIRRIYVRPMKYSQLQSLKQSVFALGQFEIQEHKREMRRRPIMISTASAASVTTTGSGRGRQRTGRGNAGPGRPGRRRGQGAQQPQPAYRTRAVRGAEELHDEIAPEEDEDDEETSGSSGDSSFSHVENLESSEDSDTESSDYSDWVADTPGPNLEPPKRAKRKPLSRRRTFSDDSSDEPTAEQQSSTGAPSMVKRGRRNKRIVIPPPNANGEIHELYRPAEWLSEVIPRKAPYYPQMGDEVVYFRQGHQRYLDAVRQKKVYKLSHSSEPWNFRTLRDHEFVRVIGIKYEIRPPRLCCLKLALVDEDGSMTGSAFKIKYHDMPDVLDFLVLRQTFDLAVQRNWNIGDRFRCMIGDGWWMGQIESRHTLSPEFPNSYFMCFRVLWDNGEYEYMSPWDMEPIDEARLPEEEGGAVPVLPEEIRATLYQPKSEEWQRGDRDGSCRRIINGLEQVMRLSIAEHFLAPVDLNIYPDYAYFIEYPIDLTTIKSRFENHFYRRITSAQFDVRYLATNAEKYNRRHTNIVKHARIITDLCLRIIRESNDIDVAAVYHQLVDVYHSSETENENDSDAVPSTSTAPSTSAAARQRVAASTRRSNRNRSEVDWRTECRQLLDLLWSRPDSLPFLEPVDTIEFPDYLEIIATPMDLRTVKEDLLGGNYDDPLDFAKDVRLIFQNSRNYNTNKRSRIYSMTLRLSALFESQIKTVISNWKAARRRANKVNKASGGGRRSGSSPTKRTPPERSRAGPSTRRGQKAHTRRLLSSEEEDDDDDDDDDDEEAAAAAPGGSVRPQASGVGQRRRNGGMIAASTSGSNRVSSSTQHRDGSGSGGGQMASSSSHAAATGVGGVGHRNGRRNRRGLTASQSQNENDEDEEELEVVIQEEEEGEDNSSGSSSDEEEEEEEDDEDTSEEDSSEMGSESHDDEDDIDVDRDTSDGQPLQRRRGRGRIGGSGGHGGRPRKSQSGDEDSEESYKPQNSGRRKGARKRHRRRKANNHSLTSGRGHKRRRPATAGGSDEDDDEADGDFSSHGQGRCKRVTNGNGRRRVGRKRRHRLLSSEPEPATNAARMSQVDESTQDTVSHTPRKKGRPPKAARQQEQVATASPDGPSTSAQALLLRNPARGRRLNGAITAAAIGGSGSRRNATENDHSYHLPVRIGRVAESDTDSREKTARPTRSSVKRAILEWARSSDVEEAEEDSEEAEEILPTPTPTKVNGGSSGSTTASREFNGPSTSRASLATAIEASTNGVARQLRTNRNIAVIQSNSDDGNNDGSDNEPLASSQSSTRSATLRNGSGVTMPASSTPHPMHLQRRTGMSGSVGSHHMTRSHATSTTSNAATSSSVSAVPHAVHDHNYLGDPGPSTSSAALRRNTSRVLSRHQRNADELDDSLDPLENTILITAPNRSRRSGIPTSTSTSTVAPVSRRGRPGRRQVKSEDDGDDDDNEDEEEEERPAGEAEQQQSENEDDEEAASDEGTAGNSRSNTDEVTDSDDNQPLTSYVPAQKRNARLAGSSGNSRRYSNRGRQRRLESNDDDDDFASDADGDNDFAGMQGRQRRLGQRQKQQRRRGRKRTRGTSDDEIESAIPEIGMRQGRGTRNQKRPRYNEQSEDDDDALGGGGGQGGTDAGGANSRKRRRDVVAAGSCSTSLRASAVPHLASQRQLNVNEDGELDEDSLADSDEQLVSVSSRGRVRKITAKARGIFKD